MTNEALAEGLLAIEVAAVGSAPGLQTVDEELQDRDRELIEHDRLRRFQRLGLGLGAGANQPPPARHRARPRPLKGSTESRPAP